MDFDGAAAPSGRHTVSGTKVTATTTHFSQFAIVWINGQAVVAAFDAHAEMKS